MSLPHGLKDHPGWTGTFTRNQAVGAIPNGTRIVKVGEEKGDATKMGMRGTVLGSILEPQIHPQPMYFVEWDNRPKVAIGVIGWKIATLR